MKLFKTALVALLVTAAFTACKKDDVTPAFKMEGSWTGKIGNDSEIPTGQYALNIKKGGTVERIGSSGSVSASGQWQLAGNSFTATYNYSNGTIVNVSGTIDKTLSKLTADWSNNGGETGTLYASKQ